MKEFLEVIGTILDWAVNLFRPDWQHVNHQTERLLFIVLVVTVCLLCVYLGGLANSVTFGVYR